MPGIPNSLGDIRAQVTRWLMGEGLQPAQINDAINDGIESLWNSLILAVLQIFMKGPVNVTFQSGSERTTVVTITDPSAAPTATDADTSTLPAITYQIAYTYATESGSETNLSPTLVYVRAINKLALVKIPITDVAGAFGWNLYVGTDTANLVKQNDAPILILASPPSVPVVQQSYEEPPTGFVVAPFGPPPPTENTTGDNLAYIRHLEFQVPNAGYQAYNSADLDSIMMRRFASQVATSSPYQQYAWNLIDQRQLEIRPAAGTTFTSRYFYIVKPRRLAFDNSPLPFPTIPSTEFLRDYALGLLFLSLHEYESADRWEAKAERRRLEAVRAVSQINGNVNDRVTPYMYGGCS